MRYILAWRLLIGTFVALLVLIALGLLLQEHPFALFGSVNLSRFIVIHWFFLTLVWLGVAPVLGGILIFFDLKQNLGSRFVLALCILFVPLFLPTYWLLGVELPWRKAARQQQQ